jgi:hypothetical protein
MSPGGRRYPARATWRFCLLLLCLLPGLLLISASVHAQTYVRTVVIGVIPDSKAPLSPSPTSPPPMAPPAAADAPPKVVDIHGQPLGSDPPHADMAHGVIVDNFGGGEAGEKKANAARQSAANLTADSSLFNRFSRAWDGSSFDAISGIPGKPGSTDPVNIGPSAPSGSTRFFTASAGIATQTEQVAINTRFDGAPPGGVVLEGSFDPGSLQSVVYDARYHALVLETPGGGRVAYFGIPAEDVTTLCRAIGGDDQMRMAVSLVHPARAYGALEPKSNLALNMFVADGFLGAIAFGSLTESRDMIANFRLAGDYAVRKPTQDFRPAVVMFTFRTNDYQDDGKSLNPSDNALDVRFVPLGETGSAALTADVAREFVENAKHITDNIDYYHDEPIVTQIFRYAQTASLLRGLKTEGVDLAQLADGIEYATGRSK